MSTPNFTSILLYFSKEILKAFNSEDTENCNVIINFEHSTSYQMFKE